MTEPMAARRVAVLVNQLRRAGAERQIGFLLGALRDAGHSVTLVTLRPPIGDVGDLVPAGIDVIDLSRPTTTSGSSRRGSKFEGLRLLTGLTKWLRHSNPDLLITFLWQSDVLGAVCGRACGVDVISSVRNDRFPGRWREPVKRLLRRWTIGTIANSRRAADALIDRSIIAPDTTRIVANAVEFQPPTDGARLRVRHELDVPEASRLWLNVTRLEPQKDHATLFAAVERLHAEGHGDVVVAVAGDGRLREQLAASAPPGVRLLGERSDVADLMAAADGLVLSSRWEGVPNVVLEAMAAGLAVVSTDVGGTGEAVVDGVTGLLVPPGRPEQLASAMARLSTDSAERERMGRAARAGLHSHAPDAVGAAWLEAISELAGWRPSAIRRPSGNRADRGPGTQRPRRVTLILQSYAGGGAQRSMLQIANGLSSAGHDTDIVVLNATGALRRAIPMTARVVEFDADRTVTALPALVRYLRTRRPDVVISTLEHVNVLTVLAHRLARSRARVVLRTANHLSSHDASGIDAIVHRLARRCYRVADVSIAPSLGAARDLGNWAGLPDHRARAVPNPVVDEHARIAAERTCTHPFFRDGHRVVLAVSRLQEHKGVAEVIDAFAAVRKPGDRLLVLGEGPQRPALERQVTSRGLRLGPEGDVDLPGFDPDPIPAMAACHVFVTASTREGLPGALIQALAAGAAVIATDCPSGPREILDDGRHGTLVPVGDGAALSSALDCALRSSPGGPGLAAVTAYDERTVIPQWSALISELSGCNR